MYGCILYSSDDSISRSSNSESEDSYSDQYEQVFILLKYIYLLLVVIINYKKLAKTL